MFLTQSKFNNLTLLDDFNLTENQILRFSISGLNKKEYIITDTNNILGTIKHKKYSKKETYDLIYKSIENGKLVDFLNNSKLSNNMVYVKWFINSNEDECIKIAIYLLLETNTFHEDLHFYRDVKKVSYYDY
jgi:hypothetical protein